MRHRLAILLLLAPVAARAEPPAGFVRLGDIAPGIAQDIRYAGSENFTGRPVPGYAKAECWLARAAAQALAKAQAEAQREGLGLVVYDCYRPQKATDAFLRWARDPSDQARKAEFYPAIDKSELFVRGYIGARSGHSLGATVDIGLTKAGAPLDFGSGFDLFDSRSATGSKAVSPQAQANRAKLAALMGRHGFANYPREWWHYTLRSARGLKPLDVDIR
jgi:D-alanyl-D-alanine dipeptidase